MEEPMRYLSLLISLLAAMASACMPARAAISENLLQNPSFEEGVDAKGVPKGWSLYGGGGKDQRLMLVDTADTGTKALQIEDGDPGTEVGITQTVPATPGLTYQATARVRAVQGASPWGAYLQLRFLPSGKFEQVGLLAKSYAAFTPVSVKATAPEGTKQAMIYLYTHRAPTPTLLIDSVELVSGVAPSLPPPPDPVPPQYTKLKPLYLTTDLVREGRPVATIVAPAAYRGEATRIQQAIQQVTGVRVPIVGDDAPEAAVPIRGHLIVLGNRSTNRTIEELYNRYFTLTDLRYPGPGGYEVRSLHNPFGGGHNVIFAGGSDAPGVSAAADALIAKIRQADGKQGSLALGWLMEIRLGKGITVPKDLQAVETWEASRNYRSVGYFGWNSISKRMAMYYMTGDPFHAREAIRLAFPDKKALEEITRIDEERIENKDDPLAGPYHYNAHLMVLYWDLIEESPVFTDEERLRVTNAFARQLNHRKDEGIYSLTRTPSAVGTRHGQWSAVSLYCLGRYFQKDYPNRIWEQCIEGARWAFSPLHSHAWVIGEEDNLYWYSTATAPILTFMLLDGDRRPLESGALQELLRGQEMLISGMVSDWALNYAAIDYLHKAAYLTQDGRWLHYRDRTGLDTSIFRLGQSFWPDERLKPVPPADLAGKWSVNRLPLPCWLNRGNGFKPEESFYFASFRSTPDASGDFILLDGYNGASRNPYHAFALLELRLNGATLLKGYRNQVLTRADGLVEAKIAMDAALRYHGVVGETAAAVVEVPNAAYCNWRRSLAQRVGRYALVIDDLAFRTDSENIEVQTLWETSGGGWQAKMGAIRIPAPAAAALPPGWQAVRALQARVTSEPAGPEHLVRLNDLGIVLLRATEAGQWLEMAFTLQEAFSGEVFADFLGYSDRGKVRCLIDGGPAGDEIDTYASGVQPMRVSLGQQSLAPGEHRLRVQVTGRHTGAEKCNIGLAGLSLRPKGAPAATGSSPTAYEIRSSDPMAARTASGITTLEWHGAVKEGQHRIFFHLLAPAGDTRCDRIAENAAALSLGDGVKAVAVAGEYLGTRAELAVVAEDHLFGRVLLSAGGTAPLVTASEPVDLDWDFVSGTLHLVAEKETRLTLALAPGASVTLDGKPAKLDAGEAGRATLLLEAGRHRIEGVKPAPGARTALSEELTRALAKGQALRTDLAAGMAPASALPPLKESFTANVGDKVVDLVTVSTEAGPVVYAAAGKTVHVLDAGGREIRRMETDGLIRVLHWWPETRLLIAGCTDEKVIAFDERGQRKWVFVSEMDPAVFRAAKQYWFKSAPGHEGIHGLDSGAFLEEGAVPGMQGKTQLFVGSACTLEILDEAGKLVKRLPVFWGTGSLFRILPGPDGSRNLAVGRSITDGAHLRIVNSKTLSVVGSGFHTVPPGVTYVGGWASMNRWHLFHEDLDGDGTREVVSEINGTWNRVTVWKEDGTALYDASFGPGASIPAKNMRDLDVADLDGDGKKEILAAISGGLVVALDHQCRKVWSRRLPSPPAVMVAVGREPRIVVGCDDGSVVILDGKGTPVQSGRVTGTPVKIGLLQTPAGPAAVLATAKGSVTAFPIQP